MGAGAGCRGFHCPVPGPGVIRAGESGPEYKRWRYGLWNDLSGKLFIISENQLTLGGSLPGQQSPKYQSVKNTENGKIQLIHTNSQRSKRSPAQYVN